MGDFGMSKILNSWWFNSLITTNNKFKVNKKYICQITQIITT